MRYLTIVGLACCAAAVGGASASAAPPRPRAVRHALLPRRHAAKPDAGPASLLQLRGGGAPAADLLARVMGWGVCIGSCGLYSPMLVRVARTRSADGLSPATWAMQLLGYLGCSIYPIRMGYDFSTYFERISLSLQACALFGAVLVYQLRCPPAAAAALLAALFAAWAAAVRGLPRGAAEVLQLASSIGLSVSIVPQLALNARQRSASGWSLTTALLSSAGNGARVFTTLQLAAGDRLLLCGFVAGLCLNAALFGQMAYYGDWAW